MKKPMSEMAPVDSHTLAKMICAAVLIAIYSIGYSNEIYKYKDQDGNWVFTDKQPESEQQAQTIQIKSTQQQLAQPEAFAQQVGNNNVLGVKNPLSAPIEVEVSSPVFANQSHRQTIPALSTANLYQGKSAIPSFSFRWIIGDPQAQQDNHRYRLPLPANGSYQISQTFNGRFSHRQQPSQFAVDFAMPVGTDIQAAREGRVILVTDNYSFGGKDEYFLNKANYVMVLHADGTYGIYAHILPGSAYVKPGDNIAAGQRLARSGSSGYSSGPHLHFAVLKNTGFKTVSVPFSFVDSNGKSFSPSAGMELTGR